MLTVFLINYNMKLTHITINTIKIDVTMKLLKIPFYNLEDIKKLYLC